MARSRSKSGVTPNIRLQLRIYQHQVLYEVLTAQPGGEINGHARDLMQLGALAEAKGFYITGPRSRPVLGFPELLHPTPTTAGTASPHPVKAVNVAPDASPALVSGSRPQSRSPDTGVGHEDDESDPVANSLLASLGFEPAG